MVRRTGSGDAKSFPVPHEVTESTLSACVAGQIEVCGPGGISPAKILIDVSWGARE